MVVPMIILTMTVPLTKCVFQDLFGILRLYSIIPQTVVEAKYMNGF